MRVVTGRRPICAYISLLCSAICILAIIIGVLFATAFAQGDNWGFIILGILIIAYVPIAVEPIAFILSVISFIRHESKRLSVISILVSVVPLILGMIMIIRGLVI